MAIQCPVGLDVRKLQEEIRSVYAAVADNPAGDFHFHRGPRFAAEFLGYDAARLEALPPSSADSFAGVANPHAIAPIETGETVLDIGCGAGTDLLLAGLAVGPRGRAIGVDMTEAMRVRARAAASEMGLGHVEVRAGDALDLPVESNSVDVVISNGVLNLTPDKSLAFREIVRVLKPGGRLQLGDIAVAEELSEGIRNDIELWTG